MVLTSVEVAPTSRDFFYLCASIYEKVKEYISLLAFSFLYHSIPRRMKRPGFQFNCVNFYNYEKFIHVFFILGPVYIL